MTAARNVGSAKRLAPSLVAAPATDVILVATLGVAAGFWVFAVRQMNGTDMGVATTARFVLRPLLPCGWRRWRR
jgi:hypothetical protein